MFKIESDTRRLKHDVLTRVAELAYQGKLNSETIDEIPFEIIPGRQPHFRCCVYKEREIIHQRVRLAMGKMPNGMQPTTAAVTVIPAACEGCPIQRYTVTENCQKCLAKKCMAACPFGAISMSGRGAWIDPNKCRECGRCAAACPYNAIADLVRPCRKACPVGAIEIGDEKLADIDQEKCISCGACMQACPFGAISDRAQILPIIEDMRAGRHLVAMIAPALEGQFGANVTMGQLRNAVKALGFDAVYEVGLGADAVYIATAALLALGCHLCRTCQAGKCNWGIATQRPDLVKRLNPEIGHQRLVNLVTAWNHEIMEIMGGMGINSIEAMRGNRLMLRGVNLTDRELAILGVKHAGE